MKSTTLQHPPLEFRDGTSIGCVHSPQADQSLAPALDCAVFVPSFYYRKPLNKVDSNQNPLKATTTIFGSSKFAKSNLMITSNIW